MARKKRRASKEFSKARNIYQFLITAERDSTIIKFQFEMRGWERDADLLLDAAVLGLEMGGYTVGGGLKNIGRTLIR